MNRQDMLKGFSDEAERLLFAKVLDQIELCRRRYTPTFTEFMDRAKCGRYLERLKTIREVTILPFGGAEECERMMLGMFPTEEDAVWESFPIQTLHIEKKNKKFGQSDLSHRDYLGSILGLGIERSKIGDILLVEDDVYCFVENDISDYIISAMDKVSKTYVKVTPIAGDTIATLPKRTQPKRVNVASMRLDAVAGEVFHLSRGTVQQLIKAEKAQVNWSEVTSTSHLVKAEDLISIRGHGRFLVGEVTGKTKKDRICLEVELYI